MTDTGHDPLCDARECCDGSGRPCESNKQWIACKRVADPSGMLCGARCTCDVIRQAEQRGYEDGWHVGPDEDRQQGYDQGRLHVEDFPREYAFKCVLAYPVISGVPNAYDADPVEIIVGFARCLESRNLRDMHEMYLNDEMYLNNE